MKRTISLLLSLIMVLALVPFSAFSVGAETDYNTSGNIALGCAYDTKGFHRTDEWGTADYTAGLTDGKASSELTYDNNWFAFCTSESDNGLNAPNGVGSVTIDLGTSKHFQSIKVNTFIGCESRIAAPAKIQAYVSNKPSTDFINLGELKYELSYNNTAWATLNTSATGRYVKIEVVLNDIFAFINEVAIFDDINVALGKSYDAEGYVTSIGEWPANYTADLTDGKASKELTYDTDWFAFCTTEGDNGFNAPNGIGTVTIDLEASYKISRIRVNAMMGQNVDDASIYSPARVTAYVSDTANGEFVEMGVLTSNVNQGATWVELNASATGRYVKIEVVLSGIFAFINEIEVYGVESEDNNSSGTGGNNSGSILPNDTYLASASPENGYGEADRDITIKLKFNESIGGYISDNIKLMKCNGRAMDGSGPVVSDADVVVDTTVSKDADDSTVLCIKPTDFLEKNTVYYVSIDSYSILFMNNQYYSGLANVVGKTPKYYFKTNRKTVGTLKWSGVSVTWDENLEEMFNNNPSSASFAGTSDWRELAMLSGILSGLIYGEDFTRIRNSLANLDMYTTEFNETSSLGAPGYIFTHKEIICGGEKKTLVMAIFRGTNGTWADIGTDVTQATGGMNLVASDAYKYFKNYLSALNKNGISTDNAVYLVTGHSLGGGVANAFSWELTKDVGGDKVFAYTFASPLTNYEYLIPTINTKVNNISNFVCPYDAVTHVGLGVTDITHSAKPFAAKHYGQIYQVLTSKNPLEAHSMDRYLKCVRDYVYITDTLFLKSVLVQCPVDVELIDEEGNTVGKIIDNKVTDDTIVPACVIGDDKYFFYESENAYTVKLVGTDSGTMDYTVFEIDCQTEDVTESKEWTNVELYDGKTMIGEACPEITDSTLLIKDETRIVAEINPDGTETPYLETMIGDINGNGGIDSMDYLYLKRAFFKQYTLSDTSVGDINKNGQIDSMDYLYLKRAFFKQYVIE